MSKLVYPRGYEETEILRELQNRPPGWPHRSRKLAMMALVCLGLLLLLTAVETVHMHPLQSDADHCPLCILVHSAAPIAAPAPAVIVVVPMGSPAPVAEARPAIRTWHPKLFTRPPPAAF